MMDVGRAVVGSGAGNRSVEFEASRAGMLMKIRSAGLSCNIARIPFPECFAGGGTYPRRHPGAA